MMLVISVVKVSSQTFQTEPDANGLAQAPKLTAGDRKPREARSKLSGWIGAVKSRQ